MSIPDAPRGAPHELSRLQTLRGMRRWNLKGALVAVHSSITTGAYSTGYALHLGATTPLIGILSAAPAWGQMLQVFSPLIIERRRRRKPLCLAMFAVSYAMWLPVALIPFLFAAAFRPWAMVVCVAVSGMALAAGAPAGTSWLTDLVPREIRGRFVGLQQSIIAGVGLVASLGAGVYLDLFPGDQQQTGFVSLFILAVVFALGSLAVWSRVPEPQKLPGTHESPAHLLALPFRHPDFRKFMLVISVRVFIAMIAGPFFTVYMLRTLHISYVSIAVFASLKTLALIGMKPVWGYLSDKFGYKPILLICSAGIALFPLPWIFATAQNYWYVIPAAQAWGGMMAAGIPLAQFNLMVKIAPEENRSIYLGCHAALVNAATALGAMLGGILAGLCARLDAVSLFGFPIAGLHYLFLGSVVLRLANMALLRRVREETSTPTRTVLEQVGRGNLLSTLWHLMRMTRSSNPDAKAKAVRDLGASRSPLAVDELIPLLDDGDREVRRETVRALGSIGDERAIAPLLETAADASPDIAEEAVEALGGIHTPLSLTILVTLLNDARPSIRKSAVLALGNFGDSRAERALEQLLEHERDALLVLETAEALSKIGNEHVLGRLERLLEESRPGAERKELAHSIGRLLGVSDALYAMLQADPMTQDAMAARALNAGRRRLSHYRPNHGVPRSFLETQIETALRHFERQRYTEALDRLYDVAARTLQDLTAGASPEAGHPVGILEGHRTLRLNMGFLDDLHAESLRRPLHREEFLLGVLAFQQVIEAAVRYVRA